LNNLKPDMEKTATSTAYLLRDARLNARKTRIMNAYVKRDDNAGRNPGILNTEELATLWHFPVSTSVRAPLIQQAPGRKAEPPMGLPRSAESSGRFGGESEEGVPDFFTYPEQEKEQAKEQEENPSPQEESSSGDDTTYGGPPGNLPTV